MLYLLSFLSLVSLAIGDVPINDPIVPINVTNVDPWDSCTFDHDPVDTIFLVDGSDSIPGQYWPEWMELIARMTTNIVHPDALAGVIQFSKYVTWEFDLGTPHDIIAQNATYIRQERRRTWPLAAIEAALYAFNASHSDNAKRMIIMADGYPSNEEHDPCHENFTHIVDEIHDADVEVFYLPIGPYGSAFRAFECIRDVVVNVTHHMNVTDLETWDDTKAAFCGAHVSKYVPPTPYPTTYESTPCDEIAPVETIFLIDGSASIKRHWWTKWLTMLKDMIDGVVSDEADVGIIQFSKHVTIEAELGTPISEISNIVMNITQDRQSTYLKQAIITVMDIWAVREYTHPRRLVLMIDGKPNDPQFANNPCWGENAVLFPQMLKKLGIEVVVMPIGPYRIGAAAAIECITDEVIEVTSHDHLGTNFDTWNLARHQLCRDSLVAPNVTDNCPSPDGFCMNGTVWNEELAGCIADSSGVPVCGAGTTMKDGTCMLDIPCVSNHKCGDECQIGAIPGNCDVNGKCETDVVEFLKNECPDPCKVYGKSKSCNKDDACTWNSELSLCRTKPTCDSILDETECQSNGCSWVSGTCMKGKSCGDYGSKSACKKSKNDGLSCKWKKNSCLAN